MLAVLALGPWVACATTESVTQGAAAPAETPTDAGPEAPLALTYPSARRAEQVDEYHGTPVADPYRWLEDPASPETRTWIEAQNQLTFGYLERIPARARIIERLEQLWNYERYSAPERHGDAYYFFKNDGLQNQSVLFRQKSLDADAEVALDPNTWSAEGTTALASFGFSRDGKWLAYAKSEGGSDWNTWYIKNLENGEVLADELRWSKWSGAAWTHDGKGFFYSRYPAPAEGAALEDANYFHQVFYHRVGTPQEADVLVYEDTANRTRGFDARVTDDGRFVVLHVWEGTDTRNRLYYFKLGKKGAFDPKAKVVKLLDSFDAGYEFVGNVGQTFLLRTDKGAPRGRLIAVDVKKPAEKSWRTLIAEGEDKLEGARLLGGGILAFWLHQAHHVLSWHDLQGKLVRTLELPTLGTLSGFEGRPGDAETFYTLTSFTYPATSFHLDLQTGKSTLFRQPKVDFAPSDYEVKQVSYPSKDGTSIPMFLVHKKGLPLDQERPTLLYGYGGFNISLTPSFDPSRIVWLEQGGVYAQPALRGGGEFGEAWHEAGMLGKKQNVFDDFAAAAEWLTSQGYTRKERLAISGRSNGGLLVGASITQRPDLFGAAIAGVGVLDMLRFHRFTIGHAWTSEYGSADVAEQFPFLYAYSPLHRVQPGTAYPATLIVTADHDDRVVPAHSFKFAAALQAAQTGSAPTLIRIDTQSGHGAGKSTRKRIEEKSDEWAFLADTLGVEWR